MTDVPYVWDNSRLSQSLSNVLTVGMNCATIVALMCSDNNLNKEGQLMGKPPVTNMVDALAKAKKGKKQKGGGARKIGKHAKNPTFVRYKHENRMYHHKVAKIEKHMAKHSNDNESKGALARLKNNFPKASTI